LDRTRFVNYGPADLDRRVARDARYSVEPHRRYYSKFDVWWSRDGDGLHTLVKGHVRTLSAGRDLPDTSAIAILTDAPGNLLLRMTDGAVHQVTGGRTLPLNTLRLPGDVLPEAFVSVSDDELWFSAGLRDLYHFANGRLEKRSAFPTSILSLCVDREGSMWVGTSGGLPRMRDVAVVTHSEREGLSSNLVCSLLRTRGGTVWIDLFALAGAAGPDRLDRPRQYGRIQYRAEQPQRGDDAVRAVGCSGWNPGVDSQNLFTLPTTGAYTIRVSANNLSTTGSYTVRRACP